MACPACGAQNAPDTRFCTACGHALVQGAAASAVSPAELPHCTQCGSTLRAGLRFCTQCGSPVAAASPIAAMPAASPAVSSAGVAIDAAPATTATGYVPAAGAALATNTPSPPVPAGAAQSLLTAGPLEPLPERGPKRIWLRVIREPTGIAQALIVLLVAVAFSAIFWTPLGEPARQLRAFSPTASCAGIPVQNVNAMRICAIENGILSLSGPLLLIFVMFVLRGLIGRLMKLTLPRLPESIRFLLPPLIATLFFTITWAGVYLGRPMQAGLVSQRIFPAVAAVFAFATLRWGGPLVRLLDPLVALRDRIPSKGRLLLAMLVPIAFTAIVTVGRPPNRPATALEQARNEQLTVIISMLSGFVLLAPRMQRAPQPAPARVRAAGPALPAAGPGAAAAAQPRIAGL